MRNKNKSAERLLRSIETAKQQEAYHFAKDLKMLLEAYPKIGKKDYLALLRTLIDKYTTQETAAVHAALMRKCRSGDIDAIRLWMDIQKENGSGAAEVNIVDSI